MCSAVSLSRCVYVNQRMPLRGWGSGVRRFMAVNTFNFSFSSVAVGLLVGERRDERWFGMKENIHFYYIRQDSHFVFTFFLIILSLNLMIAAKNNIILLTLHSPSPLHYMFIIRHLSSRNILGIRFNPFSRNHNYCYYYP